MSDNATPYPPRLAAPVRQQSRTPLLEPGARRAEIEGEVETSPSSLLLEGRRGSGSSSSSGGGGSLDGVDEDGFTPLDRTLEKIGMGRYQWSLLVLAGCGWLADNMWLQGVAVILPRVQESFDVSDRWIGLLSTSIFGGMMIGAWGWGSYSDAHGRLPAFNLTLFLTAIFGIASAFAPSFGWLCFALFLLGTGVGGSMPTDGTLFLENLPTTHHYLLTGLSVFFSLGAIFTSLLGLVVLPRFSCSPAAAAEGHCDLERDNVGWRYMLGILGLVSIVMFLARIFFIRLQESAKFLVAANRPTAAVIALRKISKMNGEEVRWSLSDVVDDTSTGGKEGRGGDYDATGSSPSRGTSPLRSAGSTSLPNVSSLTLDTDADLDLESDADLSASASNVPSFARSGKNRPTWIARFPSAWHSAIEDYAVRIEELLEPEYKRTTLLVWALWTLASAGYTIFNVFLPKFLEEKLPPSPTGDSLEQTLADYVLYTVAGLPGSLLGAYLVGTSLGRAKTLALATLATSGGTFVFVFVTSPTGVVVSSMAVSLAATLMYAVIYSLTPAAFPTSTRGTATGLASALSRLSGIVAPLLTGVMLTFSVSLPLFVSGVCFFATAACAWGLREVDRKGAVGGAGRMAVH